MLTTEDTRLRRASQTRQGKRRDAGARHTAAIIKRRALGCLDDMVRHAGLAAQFRAAKADAVSAAK